MMVTFSVLKLDRSKAVRLEQLANILAMLVTFEVSKSDKSRVINDSHQ